MFAWILVLSLFSKFALGQSLSPGDFDLQTQGDLYSGKVTRGPRSWPALKQNIDVDLSSSATVFHLPEYLQDPSMSEGDELKYTQCSPGPGVRAKLLSVKAGIAIIRLHGDHCPSDFNNGDRDPNLAFVKVSDLGIASKNPLSIVTKPLCNLVHKPIDTLLGMQWIAPSTGVKDNRDLEKYFDCYPTAHSDDYRDHYKKMIDLAGTVFGIRVSADGKRTIKPASEGDAAFSASAGEPFVVGAKSKIMKCLIFRESAWDASNRNKVSKAAGLGQQTDGDVESIKCLLQGCAKKFDVVVKNKHQIVMKDVPGQAWAQTLWHEYFSRARASMSPADWHRMMTNSQTGEPCTETMAVKTRDAYCPLNSIAAVAIDQVAIELMVREATPKYKDSSGGDFSPEEMHELLLIYGAAHDAGISKAAEAARSGDDIFAWAKVLVENKKASRQKELSGYIKDLSNCVNDSSGHMFDPMSGYPDRGKSCGAE